MSITDTHILNVIQNLIESTSDINDNVKNAVKSSLYKLSDRYANDILKIAHEYYTTQTKLHQTQQICILEIIAHIVLEQTKCIDGDVVLTLIEFSVHEMIKPNTVLHNEEEKFASDILVALGKHHCIQVMEGLMNKVVIGTIPHYMIVHTVGSLALTNCYGTIPYVKSLLTKLLPIAPMLKFDHHKQAFTYVIGSISTGIIEYISNVQKAPDPTLSKETFYNELTKFYDIIVHSWLPASREIKVIICILNAISSLIYVLPDSKINEQLPIIIPQLLNIYKKLQNKIESHFLTKCIYSLIVCTPPDKRSILLEQRLNDIVHTLVDNLTVIEPDYNNIDLLKNHTEILRCMETLFSYFPYQMIDIIKTALNSDVNKLKALIIICHMMNTQDEALKAQLKAFINILKNLLSSDINFHNQYGNRAKKIMLKIIVLLIYHRYLENDDDLRLFIGYIIKLTCIQSDTDKEFKSVCDNSLYLITSTTSSVESLLWEMLNDCLINLEYQNGVCSILRCLAFLSAKFKNDNEEINLSIEKSSKIFIRCLSLLSRPLVNYQGTYILNYLKNFAPFISSKLTQLWDKRCNEILKYLEYTSDNFKSDEWCTILLQFCYDTTIIVQNESWIFDLITDLQSTNLNINIQNDDKHFLLLTLATILSATKKVEITIDAVLNLLNSQNMDDLKTCTKMLKILAKNNEKVILTKLKQVIKIHDEKTQHRGSKTAKFLLNFINKDSRDQNEIFEKYRIGILMCFNELSQMLSAQILIEYDILNYVLNELKLNANKNLQICSIALTTITNIITTFNQNRNNIIIKTVIIDEFDLFTIFDLLNNDELILQVLDATISIIKFQSNVLLKPEQKTRIFKIIFENILSTKNMNNDLIIEKLLALFNEIILQEIQPNILEEMFYLLHQMILSSNDTQRLIALKIFKEILLQYLEMLNVQSQLVNFKFELTGFICGCLIPRLYDTIIEVRILTIYCINYILQIALKYENSNLIDNNTNKMTVIIENIQQNDDALIEETIIDYTSSIICVNLSHFQLMNFIESLLNGLLDSNLNCARACTYVLNTFIQYKGLDMYHYVDDIVVKIITIVEKIQDANVKLLTLKSIGILASLHTKVVINILLIQPLGYDTCISECWRILTKDPVLATTILSHFIKLISGTGVYDEQVSRDRMRIAIHQPLAAISAMSDIFSCSHMEELASKEFTEIFCTLYISLASYIDVSAPIAVPTSTSGTRGATNINNEYNNSASDKLTSIIPNRNAYKLNPIKLVLNAFKTFLKCSKSEHILECIKKIDTLETVQQFIDLVPKLMFAICTTMYHILPKLLTHLANYRSSTYELQRIAVYTFYCEYIHQRSHIDVILLESTIAGLLEGQSDANAIVRQLSLRGLGYIAYHTDTLITRHSSAVLNAFMNGLDEHKIGGYTTIKDSTMNNDTTINIPLESLKGLYNMLPTLDDEQFNGIQVNMSIRIKPFFESDDPELRAHAIQLFGKLVAYSKISSQNKQEICPLREQVNHNLICFLLHLSDPNLEVVKACNSALRDVVPVLNTKKFNALIQDHLIDEAKLNYNTFMPALIKIMATEIPETFSYLLMSSLTYLKSKCPVIRANTAFVIGLLCNNLKLNDNQLNNNEKLLETNKKSLETVTNRLITLLKDNDSNVRTQTAYAFSYL